MTRVSSALILCMTFIVEPLAIAKAKPPKKVLPQTKIMQTLGVIDGESDGKSTSVTIRLDKKPAWNEVPSLESHGTFLQLVLPDTIVPEPGKFFDLNTTIVSKVAVFQLTPSDAGIRFFVTEDASKVVTAAEATLLDRRMILTIDHQKLEKFVVSASSSKSTATLEKPQGSTPTEEIESDIPEYIDGLAKVESADSVIARVQVDRDLAAPSEVFKSASPIVPLALQPNTKTTNGPTLSLSTKSNNPGDNSQAPSAPVTPDEKPFPPMGTGSGINLREKLVQVTIFFGSLSGLLLLSLTIRTVVRRRYRNTSNEAPVSMKMLASLPLATRQKLSLVQVGDEKFLIGVTPEHVSFIANLTRPAGTPTGFGKLLAHTEIEPTPARNERALPTPPAPRPKLKDIPGNDEITLSEPPIQVPHSLQASSPKLTPKETLAKPGKTDKADVTQSAVRTQTQTIRKKTMSQRVNIAVGDDGPKQMEQVNQLRSPVDKPASRESVDDVTKMIREKLRQLKSI